MWEDFTQRCKTHSETHNITIFHFPSLFAEFDEGWWSPAKPHRALYTQASATECLADYSPQVLPLQQLFEVSHSSISFSSLPSLSVSLSCSWLIP